MPALTPYGAGRVAKAIFAEGTSYLTIKLLAGGTVQVRESTAISWLEAIWRWLGTCVLRPSLGAPAPVSAPADQLSKGVSWIQQWDDMKARLLASGAGLIVADAVEQNFKFRFRLVPLAGATASARADWRSRMSAARLVDVAELATWPQAESVVYVVELCTTPQSVDHVLAYRHDYRTKQTLHSKGDLVVLEGAKRHLRDIGWVRKVLTGAKAEKVAAANRGTSSRGSASAILDLRRALRKCSVEEKARRIGPMRSLEAAALQLLKSKLPVGAEALGVGASLDGDQLRLFVRLNESSADASTASSAIAASATLGAMLGCETEILSSRAAGKSVTAAIATAGKATASAHIVVDESSKMPKKAMASEGKGRRDQGVNQSEDKGTKVQFGNIIAKPADDNIQRGMQVKKKRAEQKASRKQKKTRKKEKTGNKDKGEPTGKKKKRKREELSSSDSSSTVN